MSKTCIRQSRAKLFLMMITCALLIAAGIVMVREGSPLLLVFGIAFILLFAGLFAYLSYRFCKPPLLLTYSAEGFTDHSKSKTLGFISWERVKNISLVRHNGEMYLSVLMNDPENMVEKVSKGMAIGAKKKGDQEGTSRLHISTAFMAGKPKIIYDGMVAQIQTYREEHKA